MHLPPNSLFVFKEVISAFGSSFIGLLAFREHDIFPACGCSDIKKDKHSQVNGVSFQECRSQNMRFSQPFPLSCSAEPSFELEDRGTLKIYDPYFCMGNVVKQLASLGRSAIQHEWIRCKYSILIR